MAIKKKVASKRKKTAKKSKSKTKKKSKILKKVKKTATKKKSHKTSDICVGFANPLGALLGLFPSIVFLLFLLDAFFKSCC